LSEVLFWEMFWKVALPSLLLMAGLIIGIIGTLLVPISNEERNKAAKEIEEKISGIIRELTRPLKDLEMIGVKVILSYAIGMFIIMIAGATLSDILGLPTIYDTAIRTVTVLAEYYPIVLYSIVTVYLGQETAKAVGSSIKWFVKLIEPLSFFKKSISTSERRTDEK